MQSVEFPLMNSDATWTKFLNNAWRVEGAHTLGTSLGGFHGCIQLNYLNSSTVQRFNYSFKNWIAHRAPVSSVRDNWNKQMQSKHVEVRGSWLARPIGVPTMLIVATQVWLPPLVLCYMSLPLFWPIPLSLFNFLSIKAQKAHNNVHKNKQKLNLA